MILADPGLEGSKEQLAGCTGGEIGKNRKDVEFRVGGYVVYASSRDIETCITSFARVLLMSVIV